MRDHMKLQAFQFADSLALDTYRITKTFPREEMFGLTTQMRRAAISAASNIVEGCARHTEVDYLRFLDMAYGSTKEVEYQALLAHRLGFISASAYKEYSAACTKAAKTLNALISAYRGRSQSLKPKA
jgi:four helix bundle protein